MDESGNLQGQAQALSRWLLNEALGSIGQAPLLEGYCTRLRAAGVSLGRLHVAQRTYHPQFGGFGYSWTPETGLVYEEYAHSDSPSEQWLNSPLYHILSTNLSELRERICAPGYASRFPLMDDLKAQGLTDYFATGVLFDQPPDVAVLDLQERLRGLLISWCSSAPGGFSEAELDVFRALLPELGLALKSASNRRIADDLLRVYLGQDAGARVLSGEFRRGSLRKISAVICYFDLSGFTSLSEQVPGDQVIAMLNDYFGIVVAAVQAAGGNVLKFVGDGLLAMFDQDDPAAAASAALEVAAGLGRQMAAANRRRRAEGLPVTDYTLALHAGEILYGNIGAENRLDFTVIGPAVNLAARLSQMHKALGQTVVMSEAVQAAAAGTPQDLVPLGRYMLRGVSAPQMLYTLYTAPD